MTHKEIAKLTGMSLWKVKLLATKLNVTKVYDKSIRTMRCDWSQRDIDSLKYLQAFPEPKSVNFEETHVIGGGRTTCSHCLQWRYQNAMYPELVLGRRICRPCKIRLDKGEAKLK